MADNIEMVDIGNGLSPVSANLSIDTTTPSVAADLSLLSGGVEVPVTITSESVGAGGVVTVAGTTLAGTTVGLTYTEGSPTAAVSVDALGVTTDTTETATVVCFCSGTLIRTAWGDAPVEN